MPANLPRLQCLSNQINGAEICPVSLVGERRSKVKISEITVAELKKYALPFESATDEDWLFTVLLPAAKANIVALTGLPLATVADELTGIKPPCVDDYEDLTIALLVIAADLYSNRSTVVDKSNINKVVESIIGSHQFNLL